jgi:hypothetical protein
MAPARFPITFDRAYARLSRALLLSPDDSFVEVGDEDVRVRMAWGFRTRFARTCVVGARPLGHPVRLTRGVHGFAGRWLVNGAGDGVLTIDLEPQQRAYVMGFPVRLRQLQVSVADPAALAAALGR